MANRIKLTEDDKRSIKNIAVIRDDSDSWNLFNVVITTAKDKQIIIPFKQILDDYEIVIRLEKWAEKLQIKSAGEIKDFNQLVNNWMGEMLKAILETKDGK